MFTFERLAPCFAGIALLASGIGQAGPEFGRPATPDEVAAWDISIPPDGRGLPPGTGTAKQGAAVYAAKCVSCHGDKGVGKPADALVGGIGTLDELTELIELKRQGHHAKPIIILNTDGFYDGLYAQLKRIGDENLFKAGENARIAIKSFEDLVTFVQTPNEVRNLLADPKEFTS